jgi:CoA:oxalate CoA-transferase
MKQQKAANKAEQSPYPRPLEDVTVIDMTIALAGPFATWLLAGLGARIIKIENPASPDPCRNNAPYLGVSGAKLIQSSDDDISISAINRLRNKKAVTLNLKHPGAREVFADLVQRSDIVVENFSAGVVDRLGVGYQFAQEVNPRIIYCSISGFGNDAEAGFGKAMDTIIQALSGTMQTSGGPDDPPIRIGLPFGDLCAPLFGQHIDVSMLGVLTSMVAGEAFDVLERCGIPVRTGQTLPRLAPFGIYKCSDGYVAICAPSELFARGVFKAMGREELSNDELFRTRDRRVKNVHALDTIIESWTRSLTMAELTAKLNEAGTPSAEVRDPKVAVRDPRVVARQETVPLMHPKYGEVDDVYGMGLPIRFSAATVGFDQPPPSVGEHNRVIYGDFLGYSSDRIEQLRAQKII